MYTCIYICIFVYLFLILYKITKINKIRAAAARRACWRCWRRATGHWPLARCGSAGRGAGPRAGMCSICIGQARWPAGGSGWPALLVVGVMLRVFGGNISIYYCITHAACSRTRPERTPGAGRAYAHTRDIHDMRLLAFGALGALLLSYAYAWRYMQFL